MMGTDVVNRVLLMTIPECNRIIIPCFLKILGVFAVVYFVLLFIMPESWNAPGLSAVRSADGVIHLVGSRAIPPTGILAIGLTSLICYRQLKTIMEAFNKLFKKS